MLDNIVRALKRRALDGPALTPNYIPNSLDPAFVYVPDPASGALNPACFDPPWGREREDQFMQSTFADVGVDAPDTIRVTVPRFRDTGEQTDDRRRYDVHYIVTLRYPGSPPETPARTECYGADAFWDLIGGNRNFWTLMTWRDVAPNDSGCASGAIFRGTLGRLRAERGNCSSR
jgi:hypothetical protein